MVWFYFDKTSDVQNCQSFIELLNFKSQTGVCKCVDQPSENPDGNIRINYSFFPTDPSRVCVIWTRASLVLVTNC